MRPLLIAALFLFAVAGLFAGQATAHANLVSADPHDAAVLPESPARIVLRFSEAVTPLVARLIHPDGRIEVLPAPAVKGISVIYSSPGLGRGTYVLSWRVASSDGHPIGGGQTFSIGEASTTAARPDPLADGSVHLGLWASRFALTLAIAFGLGSVFFYRFCGIAPDPRLRRALIALLSLGLIAAPAVIAFQGLDALGEPMSAIGKTEIWSAGLHATSYGRATLLAVLGVISAALALAGPAAVQRHWAFVAFLFAGLSFAAAGHAAAASPRFLTTPAVFLHALSLIAWFGAFIPLADVLARRQEEVARQALTSFSNMILPVIFALSASGFFLAAIRLERMSSLWTTDYGLALLAKLGVAAFLFLLAAVNRFLLTGPALAGGSPARKRLRRSIQTEIALSVAVVAILGLWRFTPPPRALAAAASPTATILPRSGGLEARLTLTPARVGRTAVAAEGFRLDGKDFAPLSVTIELSKPSHGIGPFSREAAKQGERFAAEGFVLPLDGFWVVRVTVLVEDFRSVVLTDIFDVQPAVLAKNSFPSSGALTNNIPIK